MNLLRGIALSALGLTGLSLTGVTEVQAREHVVLAARTPAPDADLVLGHWQGQNPRRELSGQAQTDLTVVYFTGPVARSATGLSLAMPSGELPLSRVLAGGKTVLILNTCGTNMNVSAGDFGLRGDWLAAFPATGDCAPDALARSVMTALDGDPAGWEAGLRAAGLVVRHPPAQGGAAPVRAVENDSIVITTLSPKRDTGPRIIAQEVSARGQQIPTATPAVLQNAGPPLVEGGGDRSVRPRLTGLPEPSIIVGEQAVTRPEVARGPLGVAYAERAAIRSTDAALYARMIAEGAFDPEPAQIAAAIQTELQRMSCYGGSVDGMWGRGSITGAERYFGAAKTEMPGTGADIGLYRALISGPDLTCPAAPTAAAVRQPTAPRTPAATTGTRRPGSGTATTGRPRAEQPRAPAQQTAPRGGGPRIDPNFGGTGIFR